MKILDWLRRAAIFTPEEVKEKPSITLAPKPIHINPTRTRQVSRDAARLGRLLEYLGGDPLQRGDRPTMDEIALLQARITVAGYPPPMSPSSAAELSKHLGG